jgi:hypothetical protein
MLSAIISHERTAAEGRRPMKYENGRDLLPPELLRQVQKYAALSHIYIMSFSAQGAVSCLHTDSSFRQRSYTSYIIARSPAKQQGVTGKAVRIERWVD